MEVLENPPVAEAQLKDELERFKKVAADRRLPSNFIELFTKLRDSDMFSEQMKPHGYAHLVEQSATKVPDHHFEKMLKAMEAVNVAKAMYDGRGEQAKVDFRALVRRMFEAVPLESAPLLEVFYRVERMGISDDRGLTVCMPLEAGATMEFMDQVCDLTFHQYYPYIHHIAEKAVGAKPVEAPPVQAPKDLFANADDI